MEDSMKGPISFIYVLNIAIQAIFTLLFSIALSFGLGYLFVEVAGGPEWIYVIAILLGVGSGIASMVKFVISAMQGYNRLEAERNNKRGSNGK